MGRRVRVLIFALGLAGCGGFLGLSGDDEEDEPPVPPAGIDGSLDGQGGEDGNIPPGTSTDAGDSGNKKDATIGNTDGSTDAKADATDGATDSPSSVAFKYVFVTSMAYAGTFGIGGEVAAGADADTLCKARGDASQLSKIKGRTWRAWVSTSTPAQTAAQRVASGGSLPYHLPNDTVVATGNADLTDGALAHAIDLDESGNAVGDQPVWTGSTAAGALANDNCGDWASTAGGATGRVGSTGSMAGAWSDSADRGCAQTARLYCFEF